MGKEELDVYTFTNDEVEAITAILARLAKLAERRDVTGWMRDDDSGKQSSAWEIVSALMERGRLGRKDEEDVSNILLCFTLICNTGETCN